MPRYKFKKLSTGEIFYVTLKRSEYHDFKKENKDVYVRIIEAPRIKWNTTGGGEDNGIANDANELKKRLADGMTEDEIDQLAETPRGEAIIDDYLNNQHKRGKEIADKTNGLFTRELPNGDQTKEYEVDIANKTGKILEN